MSGAYKVYGEKNKLLSGIANMSEETIERTIDRLAKLAKVKRIDIAVINKEAKAGSILFAKNGDKISNRNDANCRFKAVFTGYENIWALLYRLDSNKRGWKFIEIDYLKNIEEKMTILGSKTGTVEHIVNRIKGAYTIEGLREPEKVGEAESLENEVVIELGIAADEKEKEEDKAKELSKDEKRIAEYINSLSGCKKECIEEMFKYFRRNSNNATDYACEDFLCSLYSIVNDKETWGRMGFLMLKEYIDSICTLSDNALEQGYNLENWGTQLSLDGQHRIINTGLIDYFGSDIYVLDLDFQDRDCRVLRVVKNKDALVKYSFNILDSTMPNPINWYQFKDKLLFDITKFDAMNTNHDSWLHIIEERKHRLPFCYNCMNRAGLYRLLNLGLQSGIKQARRDVRFIVPFYDMRNGEIKYLIPLFLGDNNTRRPDAVGLIRRKDNILGEEYGMVSILTPEQGYMLASTITAPREWLESVN